MMEHAEIEKYFKVFQRLLAKRMLRISRSMRKSSVANSSAFWRLSGKF
jgi:hypothetical protein